MIFVLLAKSLSGLRLFWVSEEGYNHLCQQMRLDE